MADDPAQQEDRVSFLAALLGEAADELAAHAVALGTVDKNYQSNGDEESDQVADLLSRLKVALGRTIG